MKVFNPIYDTIFKFLMEDIEIAQGLISLIIEEDVVELMPAPNEKTATKIKVKYNQLPLQRLDYVAIIKTTNEQGNEVYHKVSIEVQKSPFVPELGRFRKYVSEKYARKSIYKTDAATVKSEYLPLKTIYFIDKTFNPALPVVLRRKGEYWDVLNQQIYTGEKDQYVELLNHDSWFIQVEKLPPDMKNELLHVLSVFAPWMRDEEDERFIDIPDNKENIEKYELLTKIVRRLQLAGKSREIEAALEMEVSLEKHFEKMLKEREEALQREKEALQREEEALQREAEERRQREEAQKREAKARNSLLKSAREMKKHGVSVDIIAKSTGLSNDEIEKL